VCRPGTLVYIPRGTVHGVQYGNGGGRMFEITGAGALAAQMFTAVDQALPPRSPDNPKRLEVLDQNGATVAGPRQ
jgi:hypothetical protein